MTTYDYRRFAGGILWTLAIGYLLSETLTAEAWRTPYSFVYNSISDLGVTNCSQVCSPLHSFMNLSFVATGLFPTNYGPMIHLAAVLPAFVARHVVLGLVAWGLWDRRRWTAIWSTVCALAGLAGGVLLA